jgi:hypothetical protein
MSASQNENREGEDENVARSGLGFHGWILAREMMCDIFAQSILFIVKQFNRRVRGESKERRENLSIAQISEFRAKWLCQT